jgi:hypothetical protein
MGPERIHLFDRNGIHSGRTVFKTFWPERYAKYPIFSSILAFIWKNFELEPIFLDLEPVYQSSFEDCYFQALIF